MSDDDIDNMDFDLPEELIQSAPPQMADPFGMAMMPEQPIFEDNLSEETLTQIKNWTCIYPIYINKQKSLAKGRRIPYENSVSKPSAVYMVETLKKLSIECVLESKKRHPRDPFTFGRIRVKLDGITKKQCLMMIAKEFERVKGELIDKDGKIAKIDAASRSELLPWPEQPKPPVQAPTKTVQSFQPVEPNQIYRPVVQPDKPLSQAKPMSSAMAAAMAAQKKQEKKNKKKK